MYKECCFNPDQSAIVVSHPTHSNEVSICSNSGWCRIFVAHRHNTWHCSVSSLILLVRNNALSLNVIYAACANIHVWIDCELFFITSVKCNRGRALSFKSRWWLLWKEAILLRVKILVFMPSMPSCIKPFCDLMQQLKFSCCGHGEKIQWTSWRESTPPSVNIHSPDLG